MNEQIFRNARIVLPDAMIHGTVRVAGGRIAAVDEGPSQVGEDMDGDYLIPGLVELHTDHLERHYMPRPGIRWNMIAAVQAHDAQIAAAGITTVFDCLRIGSDQSDDAFEPGEMRELADAIEGAQADGRLRAEHFLHLRCEVSAPDMAAAFAPFRGDTGVRLASLMDHAPGQRQFQSMEHYIYYYKTKRGMTDEAFDRFVDMRLGHSATNSAPNRREMAAYCRAAGITLASHDDATLAHVEEAVSDGIRLAEFPTSIAAARASHQAGLSVLMGAPNVVLGGSHSGNIAAADLAQAGLLDVLSSDYVPSSMLQGAFQLADQIEGVTLPKALSLVTSRPAATVGLDDRGVIAPGRRADVLRVRQANGVPQVREVWRAGQRVA